MDRVNRNRHSVSLKWRVFSLPTVVSFSIAVVFLVFLVAQFDIDTTAIWDSISGSNPLFYLLGFAVYYLSLVVRGYRWKIILQNTEKNAPENRPIPSTFNCSQLVLLGWFGNAVTWFRLGNAYRAYLLSESTGSSFFRSFGTILAERVLDLTSLFVLLAGTAIFVSSRAESGSLGVFLAVTFGLAASAVLGLVLIRHFGPRLISHLPRRLEAAYSGFHQGVLGGFRQWPMLGVLSTIVWLGEAVRLYLVIQALGFPLSFPVAFFISLAGAFLAMVPVTPGGLGLVEAGMTGLLVLWLARDEAVSVVVLDRSITYISVVILGGLLFFVREVYRRWKPSDAPASADSE